MISAFLFIFDGLISLIQLVLFVWIVISWLVAFDVLNLRNPTVYRISNALERVVDPLLAPIRRFIPPIGGLDISPIIFLLLLGGLRILVHSVLQGNPLG